MKTLIGSTPIAGIKFMITNIAACCGNCKEWEFNEKKSKFYKVRVGRCDYLDNDFCCGGHETHEAGCVGGHGFMTKETFLCKFWKS